MATEAYVKEFLTLNGLSPTRIMNMSPTFLLGIYNGMIIANNKAQMGHSLIEILKDINVISTYLGYRNKRVKDSLDGSETLKIN